MKGRIVRVVAALALAANGLGVVVMTPAHAATVPTIRITNPVLTDGNSIHRTDLEKMFSVDNNWYAKGVGFYQQYLPVGSKFALTYKVTDQNNAPLANTTVKLHVNKAYSRSNAKITDGTSTTDATKDDSQGNDQALLSGTTDASGMVTFNLQNLDTKGEAAPATLTTPMPTDPTKDALFSQIYPEVAGAADVADFIEFHFFTPAAPKVVQGPTIRLTLPALNDSNSIHRTDLEKMFSVDNTWYAKGVGFYQTYLPVGSKFVVQYKVTGPDGAPLRNTPVKLHVNKSYSKSNAKITDGTTATDPSKDDSQGNDQALLSGNTDANGLVTFNLQNTDTKGEVAPATPTTATPTDPAKDALFSQIYPEVAGAADIADFLEVHFFTPAASVVVKAPAKKITISCVKGKSVKKVTAVKPVCPKGYTKKK